MPFNVKAWAIAALLCLSSLVHGQVVPVSPSTFPCTTAAGVPSQCTFGTNLSLTGSTLNASNSATPAWSAVTPATNTQGAFHMGSGASLDATGSGTITATAMAASGLTGTLPCGAVPTWTGDFTTSGCTATVGAVNGTTVPVNAASNQVLVTTANATGAWKTMPQCLDTAGQHLNYNQSSNTWTCGSTGGTSSPTFTNVQGGTNTTAAMVVGSGASLSASGTGIVTANNTNASQLFINLIAYGADPTHTNDSSSAISSAIAAVNTGCAAGAAPVLYVPPGWYKVGSAVTQFATHCPGRIQGDGPFRSSFDLQTSFTGCMFTWSEAWNLSDTLTHYNYGTTVNGGRIEGVSITGDTTATADTQQGICLTNRNDQFLARDVVFWDINGCAICIANTQSVGLAYLRESRFDDIKVWKSGSTTTPAVWVSSIMGTANETTNQIGFIGLDIFGANGDSLVVDNCPNVAGSCGTVAGTAIKGVTEITFVKTRIERAASGAYDHVRIGGASNVGKVYNVRFLELTETAISSANTGFHVAGTGASVYNVDVWGLMNVNGTGNLIKIDNGSQINLRGVKQNASITTGLTVASSTNVSCCIYVENAGSATLTTSIDPTSASSVFTTGSYQQNGAAVGLDGTTYSAGIHGLTAAAAAAAGIVGEKAYLDCLNSQTSTVTITLATPAVVTWTPPTGFSVTSNLSAWTCPVSFTTTGALPTGLSTATTYWIIGSTYSAGAFQVADTAAHAIAGTNAVATSGSQSGTQTIQVGALYTAAATAAVAGFTLTAGDWDCTGQANYQFTAATGTSGYVAALTTSSTAIGTQDQYNSVRFAATALANAAAVQAPVLQENYAISKTYYVLSNISGMSAGSAVAGGTESCRRMR